MSVTPYLFYEDVGGALRFLARAFGFRQQGRPSKQNGKINHAAVRLGDAVVMMGWPGPKYKNPKRLGAATQCVYVTVADVEKHFAKAKKAGAKILEEPKDTPYGHRRYGAEDPEGHQWYFAAEAGHRAAPHKKKRKPKARAARA